MSDAVRQVVVTPVYEDAEASIRLFHELREAVGPNLFVIAVDDGSVRQPVEPSSIESAGLDGIVIRLKRNLGHQRAIAVGLSYVADHMPDATCVVMDSDGEDRPSTIPVLMAPLASKDIDAVVAHRQNRVETLKFKVFFVVYKFLFKLLAGRRIGFGNYMVLKPLAVQRLSAMPELWIHVAACMLVSKLRIARRRLDRGPRYAGSSRMNFSGLVLHGFRAFMVFAEDVLVRTGIFCAGVAFLALLGISISIALKSIGMATPGWFSVALGILVLLLVQTGALALMSLMLTGIVRGSNMASINYLDMIDDVLPTGQHVHITHESAR